MRTRISVLLTMALVSAGALMAIAPTAAGAQALGDQGPFGGYSTGTVISTNALTLGDTTTGAVRAAVSGDSVDSTGLGTPITDELGQNVQPALPAKNAYGRGTGLETGLVVPADQQADVNQLLLSGLAEASAPPPEGVPTPITKNIALDLAPIATASALSGEAQAIYDPNTCAIGQPISFGQGSAADLRLVGAPDAPLVGAVSPGDPTPNTVSKSQSFSYFIPNPDGSFGLVSETHQIIAPITIANNAVTGPALTIEVAGEFILRSTATGIAGDPRNGVTYPGNPLITIKGPLGVVILQVHLSDILSPTGLTVGAPGIVSVSLGQAPRAIGGAPGSAPEVAADGTLAAGAVDAVGSVQLLEVANLGVLDLRIGHMEAAAVAPAGGIHCTVPVAKTASPNPASAGQEVTWSISIPSDPAFFAEFFACDLVNIKATDTHSVVSGDPRFELTSADHGGVINGDTVTWDDLGAYRRGDPPIVLTLKGRIVGGTGVVQDTANVTATLNNCDGGVTGQAIVGQGGFENVGLTGSVTLTGPEVKAGNLAATGGDARYLLFGGLFLLVGLDVRRRLRTRGTAKA
ncbi:MAG TPA: hypothetical protein VHS52_07425 [Acidimicrobiales bacterium]|nr:hypothetical protein [Acidimicrobiales bacterium]